MIRAYLRGDSDPTLGKIEKIARACNVTVGWLADGEGGPVMQGTEQKTNISETETDIPEQEIVDQTLYVIRSKTIYKSALLSNVRAFYQGVKREEEMQGVNEKLEQMEKKNDRAMEELKRLILNQGAQQKRDSAANA